MKLSILICTLPSRIDFFRRIRAQLERQVRELNCYDQIQILSDATVNMSIGAKRNTLLQKAVCDYVAFIDDDDRISENYISLLFEGIEKKVDCCSLLGIITEDGENPLVFEHSLKYQEYLTKPDPPRFTTYGEFSAQYVAWIDKNKMSQATLSDGTIEWIKYERYPNHLNCIKTSIAKRFTFPEKNHGEDTDWATQVFNSGLLKTEHQIKEILYFYEYRRKK